MDEKEYNDWMHKACDTCDRIAQEFDYFNDKDEHPTKWFCFGRIVKPENPKDEHEEHNEIRVCLWDPTKPEGKACFDWTPWEVQTVLVGLCFAVSDYLIEFQPRPLQESLSSEK